ncbi:thioredoxin [Anaerosalibacter massiliensis]|uniref:Thioredoxin n=1 Tax=Anaerosalibacter massiliensis TaxID=1347392 RepID=A0A9X2MI73_9FIRM|nr:thioredoxin [Anaerosalibacter massiliensis]MCR2044119.1 thioredoxin [Anaerosalibacter massiliensis]
MKEINDSLFEKEVIESDMPVVVDFWAPWCGPCKAVGPVMEELSKQYSGKIKFVKVNVDENLETSQEFRILSIPTIMIFKDGKSVETSVGFKSKSDIEKILVNYI